MTSAGAARNDTPPRVIMIAVTWFVLLAAGLTPLDRHFGTVGARATYQREQLKGVGPMDRRSLLPIIAIGAVLLPVAACADSDDSSIAPEAYSSDDTVEYDTVEYGDDAFVEDGALESVPPDGGEPAQQAQTNTPSKIIEASVTMYDEDVEASVNGVVKLVSQNDGTIDARNITTDVYDQRARAELTVRIPPDDAEKFLDDLSAVSDVADIHQSEADVTSQLVDLEVRIENARASVDRVRDLMEQTTNITELAELESQLTQRQTNLEQMQAERQYLAGRASMATIHITIVEPREVVETTPTDSSLQEALSRGWDFFVTSMYLLLLTVATLAPWIVLAVLIFLIVRAWRRRSKRTNDTGAQTDLTDS